MNITEKVYSYICDTYEKTGMVPTVREIGAGVGLKSSSSVHWHMKQLVKAGLLLDGNGKSRAYIPQIYIRN